MLIDIHAHLNDIKLLSDAENIILRAKDCGVKYIVCSGYNYESSKAAVELAEKYEEVYATIGMHPHDSKNYDEKMERFLIENSKNKKVIAIGEIGLDYHYDFSPRDAQKEIFIKQIKIADSAGLPIVIHTREAMGETLAILKHNMKYINHGGMFHCYSGSIETAKEIEKMGFIISVGGVITFKNAVSVIELIKQLPSHMLTVETDSPYLTPEPYRGKTNEPKNVKLVADKISKILGVSLEEVEKLTGDNVKRIFKKII